MVGGRGAWVMGIEEGTCWDEYWVLYGHQLDNKFHIKKKQLLMVKSWSHEMDITRNVRVFLKLSKMMMEQREKGN